MFNNRKNPKSFSGAIGSGLPYDDFETAVDRPSSVMENLDKFRPMVKAVKEMAQTDGWRLYVQPFLEKKRDPSKILELIEQGKDPKLEAAVIKAYSGILNLVNSVLRTGSSIERVDMAKAAAEAEDLNIT